MSSRRTAHSDGLPTPARRDADRREYHIRRNPAGEQVLEVVARGQGLRGDPLYNKDSAFTQAEREAFGLEGILPARTQTLEQQAQRVYERLLNRSTAIDRYLDLAGLQARNEQLYYRVLIDHLEELLPVIYTPTVAQVAQRFSDLFQGGYGIWINPSHRGRVAHILRTSARVHNVRLIVATDNEAVLGIGDQGVGGMAISAGKLALYCAAAGINPAYTLPISLDVGTDNFVLLNDPNYLGWCRPRLRGTEYIELVDEFVEAVREVFPSAILQWEDFRKDNALTILERYRHRVPSFNDDIQGTGATVVAGVLTACRALGQSIADQRILIYGAGAAGFGIAQALRAALRAAGLSGEALSAAIAAMDSRGFLVSQPGVTEPYKRELSWSAERAMAIGVRPGADLLETVRAYLPTVLVGTSAHPGAFNQQVIAAMSAYAQRPVVLALSNPNALSEAEPQAVLEWTSGRALVATGSPFPAVQIGSAVIEIGQGNNAFVFPGLGLGMMISESRLVSESILAAAAHAVADAVTEEEISAGLLYPRIGRLPEVARRVAAAVVCAAISERKPNVILDTQAVEAQIASCTWTPAYPTYEAGRFQCRER